VVHRATGDERERFPSITVEQEAIVHELKIHVDGRGEKQEVFQSGKAVRASLKGFRRKGADIFESIVKQTRSLGKDEKPSTEGQLRKGEKDEEG